jgi:hypothetical protein
MRRLAWRCIKKEGMLRNRLRKQKAISHLIQGVILNVRNWKLNVKGFMKKIFFVTYSKEIF